MEIDKIKMNVKKSGMKIDKLGMKIKKSPMN